MNLAVDRITPFEQVMENLDDEQLVNWFLLASRLNQHPETQHHIVLNFFNHVRQHEQPFKALRAAAVLYEDKDFKKTNMYMFYRKYYHLSTITSMEDYTSPIFQRLLYVALVETPNDKTYINDLYEKIYLKDLELNPILQEVYERFYQITDEENARKVLVVCSYAYRTKDTIVLEKIIENVFPHIGKRMYSSYAEYEKARKHLTYTELNSERLAYSFYLSLPSHVIKKPVNELFKVGLFINLTEGFVRDNKRLPIDEHYERIFEKYSNRRANEIDNNKKHSQAFKEEWTTFTSYVDKNGDLKKKKGKEVTLLDFIIDAKERALKKNPDLKYDKETMFLKAINSTSTSTDVRYLPMTNADVYVIGEYLRIYEKFIGVPVDSLAFLRVLNHYKIHRLEGRRLYTQQFLSSDDVDITDRLNTSITTRINQQRELEDVKNQVDTLNKDFKKVTEELEALEVEVEKLTNEKNTIKSEYDTFKTNMQSERKKYQKQHREYNAINRENNKLKEEVEQLTNEIKQITSHLEQTERQLKKSEEIINKYLPNNFEYLEQMEKEKEELIHLLKKTPVAIIGGHVNWQNKLAEELTSVSDRVLFVDIDKRVELDFFKSHKHIFYVSKYNNHGFFKQMEKELYEHNVVHYLDTTNINQTISTMLECIKNN